MRCEQPEKNKELTQEELADLSPMFLPKQIADIEKGRMKSFLFDFESIGKGRCIISLDYAYVPGCLAGRMQGS